MITRKVAHWSLAIAIVLCFAVLGALNVSATVNVTIQPQSQITFVGSNAAFTAQTSITAGETITGYTWKFSTSTNGQPPFTAITGATNSVLSILNAQTNNSG